MDLLRFSTAGSVDDGKSTLIGRLLYDSKGVFEDQLEAAKQATRNESAGEIDLSLLTDGLRAEREQGITIDVAYRYFATPQRKFIIADTPGHEQYTRNMVTGASTSEASIVLVDARKGILEQSRRHTIIAHLLGIRHLVVAVNKMDLVDFEQEAFAQIETDMLAFLDQLEFNHQVSIIPISALQGDNVVTRSRAMDWYDGPTLLDQLESLDVTQNELAEFRYPVQTVLRPNLDFRAYAGEIASGSIRPGDEITVLPSGLTSRIKRILTADGALQEAFAPMAVALQLEDEIDISRGDMLVSSSDIPQRLREFDANLIWMDECPLQPGRPYLIKHTTRNVRARIDHVEYRIDINQMDKHASDTLSLNEIGRTRILAAEPLFLDAYSDNRRTGSFIIIDQETNNTVAAGLVCDEQPSLTLQHSDGRVLRGERERHNGHRAGILWLKHETEAPAPLAALLERQLFGRGLQAYHLESTQTVTTAMLEALVDSGQMVILDGHAPNDPDPLHDDLHVIQFESAPTQIEQGMINSDQSVENTLQDIQRHLIYIGLIDRPQGLQ